ncbi:MAG TPA: amidohydrolase family protein, partial [Acidimicrobiales bacterium]|nr:amidohydrolase family protein [Acidimicrobiales bacterium]
MSRLDRTTYAQLYGPTTGDGVVLGDTGLVVRVGADDTGPGDELLGGCAKTFREGLASSSGIPPASQLDLLVSNVVVLDPVLGATKTNIGVKDGRIVGVGRAGSPEVVDDPALLIGAHTALVPGEGLIATPGIVDSHVHLSSPALLPVALAAGTTTVVGMGMGGVWDVGVGPEANLATLLAGLETCPVNVSLLARGSALHRGPLDHAMARGASGFKVHEDFGAYPEVVDTCLEVAEDHDVAVALHSDSLNESGMLADTVAATAGRTVHAYHVEGGGGHPDLLEILGQPHVLASSTTPTIPYALTTEAELV